MTVTRATILTPTPGATTTTFQVMSYNALTDGHTLVLDLNDHNAFTMHNKGLKMAMPPKEDSRSFNLRTPGERVVREQYKNRHITYTCWLRDATPNDAGSTTALLADVRALLAAINNPPYELRIALPKSTQYTYADVVKVTHDIPSDPQQILAQAITHLTIDFECLPGLRGDRLVLQNLAQNPGFEAPSGPAVTAFADTLANFNAYSVQAGGALAADLTRYTDVILADAPVRYFRMDEASGATAFDASASLSNGTLAGVSAYAVSGALAGDTDTGLTFNGTTGILSLSSSSGLPSGANAAASLEWWVKLASLPGATAIVAEMGDNTVGGRFYITIDTSGHPQAQASAATPTGAALSTGAWHHLVATYDGTSLRMYVDGALYGGPTAATWTPSYGSSHYGSFGAASNGANWLAGSMDECAMYTTALSATQVTNHYNAGHVAPASNLASSMVVPSGGRVSFGSPAWSALNLWQVRFRYNASLSGTFYLHYTDGNNYLSAVVNGTSLTLNQAVGGTTHQLGQTTGLHLVPGAWYWLQTTQFPSVSTAGSAQVQAQLFVDNTGAVGASLAAMLGPVATFDSVTALEGRPQIQAASASLPIGGVSAGHSVALFGPGGWTFAGLNGTATGTASLAWDGARPEMGMSGDGGGNTYSGGPVTSFGAARLDLAPAGTVDAQTRLYTGGAAGGTAAIPVSAATDVLGICAWVKTSAGLGASATLSLLVTEYDASGTQLRQSTAATLTGPQTSWTQLSANYTTGASCAYVDVALRARDTTANSAGDMVWWDNVQVWDQTTTGQTTVPYCELRFSQSPAQLMVSGLLGDIAAPAFLALGLYISSWGPGTTVSYAVGRRARASAGAELVGPALSHAPATFVLDSGSYGGFYITTTVTSSGWNPRSLSSAPSNFLGIYHVWQRMYTSQSAGNLANVQVRVLAEQVGSGWFGKADFSDYYSAFYGAWNQATTASATWTNTDVGMVIVPPSAQGTMTDPSALPLVPRGQLEDVTGGGSTMRVNWQILLPVDSDLLIGNINNPSNAGVTYANQYVWAYFDGLNSQQGQMAAATYGFGTTPLINPASGAGGTGTTSSGYLNVNGAADPFTALDPNAAGLAGVNQFAAVVGTSGAMPQLLAEVVYTPLYLYPR